MRRLLLILTTMVAGLALAQTPPVPPAGTGPDIPTPSPAWLTSLPTSFVGGGGTWVRGSQHPMSLDFSYGQRIAKSRWLVWSRIETPIFKQAAGSPPIPSTLQAGAGYIPVCSDSGSVCLVLIALGGVAAASGGAGAAPAFTGSVAVPIRIHGGLYAVPYIQASNLAYSATSGALASMVISPGAWLVYGFGK